jgi:hypothetical protein
VRDRRRYCEDYIGASAHQLVSHHIQSRREEAAPVDLKIGALYKTLPLAVLVDDGTVRAVGAQKFLEDAKVTLDQLSQADNHSPELSEIEISLLLAVSDVKDALGDYKGA